MLYVMDDLHSIASISRCRSSSCGNMDMSSRSCISNSFSQGWLSNWNDNHIGVFNAAEDNMSQYMDMMKSSGATVAFVDDGGDHFSRSMGYLQDVLFDFTSKRRRLNMLMESLPVPDLQPRDQINYCWTSNLIKNCCEEFDSALTQFTKPNDIISDLKTGDQGEANSETCDDSSSSSQKEYLTSSADDHWTPEPVNNHKGNPYCIDDPIFSSAGTEKRKKRTLAKVAYPFALVKPGGFEGDMTLNDINERILMPPTRPVRHPVGDFACRPIVSPDGPGLSGKAVVAFTRVHTQGRGTITIIRTRG